ncbi:hypothetical protein LZC95_01415 [Pendulispora brunnea]|uniref:Uncharacterized protein n=1 Tax=Pendulispora brunnea TaxID=2905690 RepID=A0ABZ2KF34_9BACT
MSPAPNLSRDRARIGVVGIPALALLPFAAYMGFYCARAVQVRSPYAVAVGALIFVIFFLPVARLAVRILRSHTWDKEMSPKRVFARTVPLYAMVLFFPVGNLVMHVETVLGAEPSTSWLSFPIWLAVLPLAVLTVACAWPILTAARVLATQAVSAVDEALLGSAVSLLVMGAFARLSAEAAHFHAVSRAIGLVMHLLTLGFAIAAAFCAWRRWQWAKGVFRAGGTQWGIVSYQPTIHGRVAPLDVTTDASAADGIIVRYADDPGAPYRSREAATVAVARTWLDEVRTLRPLARRRSFALAVLGAALMATPFLVTPSPRLWGIPAPAAVHNPAEDTRTTQPSGPLGFPRQCARRDPVYFIPMGHQSGFDIQDLANRYAASYHRPFLVLKPREMPRAAYNEDRGQWDGEKVLSSLVPEVGRIAPKDATLIVLTSDDLYLGSVDWRFAFGTRGPPNMAIVSSARMRLELPGIVEADQIDAIADYRFRKMITRNLGFVYCNLQNTFRPKSILYFRNMGQPDLDEMDESVW